MCVQRTRRRAKGACCLGAVREGARERGLICAGPRAPLGLCKVGGELLTTVHANLEAMVLRARRGTHQGRNRLSSGDARAEQRWVAAECSDGGLYAALADGAARGVGGRERTVVALG